MYSRPTGRPPCCSAPLTVLRQSGRSAALTTTGVLDKESEKNPFELYEVLERVKSVMDRGNYEFVNLSIGPALPVDDDEIHAWTAVLDEHPSDGRCLASIAAGNTGEEPEDPVLQMWRVQVPSDCVNGLTVGASDRRSSNWARAPYSSKGPGRSPGIVKPDLVTLRNGSITTTRSTRGTSRASSTTTPITRRACSTTFRRRTNRRTSRSRWTCSIPASTREHFR